MPSNRSKEKRIRQSPPTLQQIAEVDENLFSDTLKDDHEPNEVDDDSSDEDCKLTVIEIRKGLRRLSNDATFNEMLASEYNQEMHTHVESIVKLLSTRTEATQSSCDCMLRKHGEDCFNLGGQCTMLRVFYAIQTHSPTIYQEYSDHLREQWHGIGTWKS